MLTPDELEEVRVHINRIEERHGMIYAGLLRQAIQACEDPRDLDYMLDYRLSLPSQTRMHFAWIWNKLAEVGGELPFDLGLPKLEPKLGRPSKKDNIPEEVLHAIAVLARRHNPRDLSAATWWDVDWMDRLVDWLDGAVPCSAGYIEKYSEDPVYRYLALRYTSRRLTGGWHLKYTLQRRQPVADFLEYHKMCQRLKDEGKPYPKSMGRGHIDIDSGDYLEGTDYNPRMNQEECDAHAVIHHWCCTGIDPSRLMLGDKEYPAWLQKPAFRTLPPPHVLGKEDRFLPARPGSRVSMSPGRIKEIAEKYASEPTGEPMRNYTKRAPWAQPFGDVFPSELYVDPRTQPGWVSPGAHLKRKADSGPFSP